MIQEFPLTKANRIQLARAFKNVDRVDLSIESIIEGQMGKAFVDDVQYPNVFKIEVGPFFYYAGDVTSTGGQVMLENLTPYMLFMPSAPGWIEAGKTMYGERLAGFTRYSFSFESITAKHLDHLIRTSAFKDKVRRMDQEFAAQLWGKDHFIDLSDFDSAEDFVQRGIGFYIKKSDKVVGSAYSSLVCSKGIEVSLFVLDDYRRQGIATILGSCLLKWCQENNMEAHWDAANLESCKLAEKLGYTPQGTYQAHYLVA